MPQYTSMYVLNVYEYVRVFVALVKARQAGRLAEADNKVYQVS